MRSSGSPADPTGGTAEPVRVVLVSDVDAALAERLLPQLSGAERTRAAGIRAGGARIDFVVARAILREELGRVLGCDPAEVPIRATSTGKPVVDGGERDDDGGDGGFGPGGGFGEGGDRPQVGVAHTDGLVLVAWHPTQAVGIDVERADRAVGPALVDRVATEAERAALAGLPDSSRSLGLLRLWVRKEAVAKADGRGLALVLADLEVLGGRALAVDAPMHEPLPVQIAPQSLGGGEGGHEAAAKAVASAAGQPVDKRIAGDRIGWVRDLEVGSGHLAAVATIGAPAGVQVRPWAGALGR